MAKENDKKPTKKASKKPAKKVNKIKQKFVIQRVSEHRLRFGVGNIGTAKEFEDGSVTAEIKSQDGVKIKYEFKDLVQARFHLHYNEGKDYQRLQRYP